MGKEIIRLAGVVCAIQSSVNPGPRRALRIERTFRCGASRHCMFQWLGPYGITGGDCSGLQLPSTNETYFAATLLQWFGCAWIRSSGFNQGVCIYVLYCNFCFIYTYCTGAVFATCEACAVYVIPFKHCNWCHIEWPGQGLRRWA